MSAEKKPWSMRWVVAAIVVVIPIYTILTLRFRKPGQPFQPYQEMHDRAVVLRLLSGGYQRIDVDARRPADPGRGKAGAEVSAVPGGIPRELQASLIDAPQLPAEVDSVVAAPEAAAGRAYPVEFACLLPDNRKQLSGAHLYLKGFDVAIVPDFERIPGGLMARTRQSPVLVTVPAGALKPGSYHVILVGERTSRTWTLRVR